MAPPIKNSAVTQIIFAAALEIERTALFAIRVRDVFLEGCWRENITVNGHRTSSIKQNVFIRGTKSVDG